MYSSGGGGEEDYFIARLYNMYPQVTTGDLHSDLLSRKI